MVLALSTRAKVPGEQMSGEEVELHAQHQSPEDREPYERLLGDAINGDQTLFTREDAVEAAWAVVDPVLGNVTPLHIYEPNTWGPTDADEPSSMATARGSTQPPAKRTCRTAEL